MPDALLGAAVDRWISVEGLMVASALAVAGLVRGFSGFGAAMIFTPLASAVWGPQVAIAMLCVIDGTVTLPLVARAIGRCTWREVTPIAVGMAVGTPFGVRVLAVADAETLRWAICAVVFVALALMASGWRYVGRPTLAVTLATGGLAGFMGGSIGIAGPVVVLFWLAGQSNPATVRANIIALFVFATLIQSASLAANGLLTIPGAVSAAVAIPLYALGIVIGARCFWLASETQFRRLAFTLILAAAIAGLPVW